MDSPYRLAAPAPLAELPAVVASAVAHVPDDGGELELPVYVGEVEADADPSFHTRSERRDSSIFCGLMFVGSLVILALCDWY